MGNSPVSSPRAHANTRERSNAMPSQASPPPAVDSPLWNKLRRATGNTHLPIVNPTSIDSQFGVICPQHSAVQVDVGGKRAFIHANRIGFSRKPGGHCQPVDNISDHIDTQTASAKAGQSPQHFALCEKFLIDGIDSGRGLFQFVSRKAQAISNGLTGTSSNERPIIDQLRDAWQWSGQSPGSLWLGDRYEVLSIGASSAADDHHADHRSVMLTVRELAKPHSTITVPLTQAGMKFTDRVLRKNEIERANALLEAHRHCGVATGEDADAADLPASASAHDPMIISTAGIGRNAALIVYREAMARIDVEPAATRLDERYLDAMLENIITSGRRDRGPKFIHSDAQLQEVKAALAEVMDRRNEVARKPTSPVASPRGLHRQSNFDPPAEGVGVEVEEEDEDAVGEEIEDALEQVVEVASEDADAATATIADATTAAPIATANSTVPAPPPQQTITVEVPLSSSAPAYIPAPTVDHLTSNTIPPQQGITPAACDALQHYLEAHPDDSLLQLLSTFTTLKNPALAAWCAAQIELALTPVKGRSSKALKAAGIRALHSLHPAVSLGAGNNFSIKYQTLYAEPGSELAQQQPHGLNTIRLSDILQNDLRHARNAAGSWQLRSSIAGNEQQFIPDDLPKLSVQQLVDLVASPDVTPLELTVGLAANNPACATFFSFISHALLIKDYAGEAPTVRYPYVDDPSLPTYRNNWMEKPFLPTFLEGVERRYKIFDSSDPSWRIKTTRGWVETEDKQSLLNHIFLQAMRHLQADAPTAPDMPIYPLAAYQLLAEAINVRVPPYLVAHEQNILTVLAENARRESSA